MIQLLLFVLFVVVIIGVIAIDHRLHQLVQIQRAMHKELLLANARRTETKRNLGWWKPSFYLAARTGIEPVYQP
jgi:hypothetical protein